MYVDYYLPVTSVTQTPLIRASDISRGRGPAKFCVFFREISEALPFEAED